MSIGHGGFVRSLTLPPRHLLQKFLRPLWLLSEATVGLWGPSRSHSGTFCMEISVTVMDFVRSLTHPQQKYGLKYAKLSHCCCTLSSIYNSLDLQWFTKTWICLAFVCQITHWIMSATCSELNKARTYFPCHSLSWEHSNNHVSA